MTYEKENEVERLTKKWESKKATFENKEVVCTRDAEINGTYIKKGVTYTVKEVDMYLGTTPCFILVETGTKMWHPDNFKLK
jgi:hypothetical protein